VRNMTNGAVSDATAQLWANANNRDSGWYQWADAQDQPRFLLRLGGAAVVANATEQEVLSSGGYILQPACNLYPENWQLFKVGSDGEAYFARKHLPADDAFVFVAVYRGPCAETLVYPDGHRTDLTDFTSPTIGFIPGRFLQDPVLGPIWFPDAGGNCSDPAGPPQEWCAR